MCPASFSFSAMLFVVNLLIKWIPPLFVFLVCLRIVVMLCAIFFENIADLGRYLLSIG